MSKLDNFKTADGADYIGLQQVYILAQAANVRIKEEPTAPAPIGPEGQPLTLSTTPPTPLLHLSVEELNDGWSLYGPADTSKAYNGQVFSGYCLFYADAAAARRKAAELGAEVPAGEGSLEHL